MGRGWADVHPLQEAEDEHQNAMEEDGLSWIIVEDPVKRVGVNMKIVWGGITPGYLCHLGNAFNLVVKVLKGR